MKSIIEQASSIMKAIEKAWDQADKPKDFSIKIFEKEEKNFFGMTTKPAKIGIFFTDKPTTHDKSTIKPRSEIKECRDEVKQPLHKQQPQPVVKPQPSRPEQPRPEQSRPVQKKPFQQRELNPSTIKQEEVSEKPRRISATWNDTMIQSTESWLKRTLSLMEMNGINFTTEIAGKNLKLTFNTPLIADVMHEKQLFRSFAHLIMSSLRNQYKQEIKDLKVILIRPE
jgi:predicted RNA-binding protein Jag